MERNKQTFKVSNSLEFTLQAMGWASQFRHCAGFTNNNISFPKDAVRNIIAADAYELVPHISNDYFASLKNYHLQHRDWLFGHFSYDLKNEVEILNSNNPLTIDFGLMTFFRPRHVISVGSSSVTIESTASPAAIFQQIGAIKLPLLSQRGKILPHCSTTRAQYVSTVEALRQHIAAGDIYEINYCIEFGGSAPLDPFPFFLALNKESPTPFATFYKCDNNYLMCASPERFIKKDGRHLISQPIKGTARRGNSKSEDMTLKAKLRHSEKELAENMMIVDLVRNDLARSCKTGSVQVDEMFGIYTFRQLHQMISTISGELREDIHFVDAIRYAFPMGSMTGAPKIKVMELVEHYENTARGLYSGSVGYITPSGDFDFNVVIRGLAYNATTHQFAFHVGSAITYDSVAEEEYNECLLKAHALQRVLTNHEIKS